MKLAKKLLVLCLVVLMCIGTLVACGGDDTTTTTPAPNGPSDPSNPNNPNDPSTPGEGNTPPADPIPNLNVRDYAGQTATMFYKDSWGPTNLWIEAENVGTESVDRATRARIDEFQTRTGVTLIGIPSDENAQYLLDLIEANDVDNIPDLFFVGGYDAMTLLRSGELLNLTTEPNIDLSKDCWHQSLNQNLALVGSNFLVSGYYATSNFEFSHTMFFDRDVIANITKDNVDFTQYPELAGYTGAETLYEWARNGQWTWDKAIALAKCFVGAEGRDDYAGIQYQSTEFGGPVTSLGVRAISDSDGDGIPQLTAGDETNAPRLQYAYDYIAPKQAPYVKTVGNVWSGLADESMPDLFGLNHTTLFRIHLTRHIATYGSGAYVENENNRFSYGILPMPKYNVEQESYYTDIGGWYSTIACIPAAARSTALSTFVLQTFTEMGRTAYNDEVYTIFEATIQNGLDGRYAAAADANLQDSEMLQIIMDSVTTEYGTNMSFGTAGRPHDSWSSVVSQNKAEWSNYQDVNAGAINEDIKMLLVSLGLAAAE